MLKLAESRAPLRVEFANVQYYGWPSPTATPPTHRAQLDHSSKLKIRGKRRLRGTIRVEYVVRITTRNIPSPAWAGWDAKLMPITPLAKRSLHAAQIIPGMKFKM